MEPCPARILICLKLKSPQITGLDNFLRVARKNSKSEFVTLEYFKRMQLPILSRMSASFDVESISTIPLNNTLSLVKDQFIICSPSLTSTSTNSKALASSFFLFSGCVEVARRQLDVALKRSRLPSLEKVPFDTELDIIARARFKTDPTPNVDDIAVELEFKLDVVAVELELEDKPGGETKELGEAFVG